MPMCPPAAARPVRTVTYNAPATKFHFFGPGRSNRRKNRLATPRYSWHHRPMNDYPCPSAQISQLANPGELTSSGQDLPITAGFAESPFGRCLVAQSPAGICRLSFPDAAEEEREWGALRQAWPQARLRRDDTAAARTAAAIFAEAEAGKANESPSGYKFRFEQTSCSTQLKAVTGCRSLRQAELRCVHLVRELDRSPQNVVPCDRLRQTLPLFAQGTPFQVMVWQALLRIPCGSTLSYGQLAAAIGRPTAVRAVAGAVAKNPIAFLIPCHRVLPTSGGIGGYRWGQACKRAMLTWEKALPTPQPPQSGIQA